MGVGNNDNDDMQALFSPGQHWNLLLNLEPHTMITISAIRNIW